MTVPFTPEELASMTPAEREAVTHMDDSDTKFIGGGDDDGDDDTSAAGNAAATAAAAADEGEAGAAAAVDADTTKKDEKDPVAPVVVEDVATEKVAPYTAPQVEDYDGQIAALEARKDEAFKKLTDGDITDSDYRAIEKEVSGEIRALDTAMIKGEVSRDMTEQHAKSTWLGYVEQQLESAKAAGADLQGSVELMAELDRTVKLLAKQAMDEPDMVKHLPATKPGVLITNMDKWVLSEAIKIVKIRNNLGPAATVPKTEEKKQDKGRAPDLSGIPPTLGRVPVAADPNAGGDEFAYLNKLNGIEYERALAKLTPDQIERYTA